MKKFTNFNFGDSRMDREWTEVEPRMDRSTLATMWRYVALMVMVFGLGIGQMWGASPFTIEAPDQITYTQDGITVSGQNTTATVGGSSSQKVYNTTNASVHIFSQSTNITGISFKACFTSSYSGDPKPAITLQTSTGGVFSVLTSSDYSISKDNASPSSISLTNLGVPTNTSSVTYAITFNSPVKAIELTRGSNAAVIRDIEITYNAPSSYTTYYAASIIGSSNDDGSVTTGPTGATVTFDHSTSSQATINTKKYDKMEGNQVINLGTGNTFQVGDQIILDICSSGNNYSAGGIFDLTGSSDPTISVVTSKTVAAQVAYVVVANDGIAGQTSATIGKVGTTSYIHGITVLRAAASDTYYLCSDFSGEWTETQEITPGSYVDVSLPEASYLKYKIKKVPSAGDATWYGRDGSADMERANCTGWTLLSGGSDCYVRTDIAGTYRFAMSLNGSGVPVMTVTYPTGVAVTLNMNGGGDPDTWQAYTDGVIPVPGYSPSRDGYAFDGWYADAEGTEPWVWSTTVSSATTLYAKWSNAWYFVGAADWSAYHLMTRSAGSSYWYYACEKGASNNVFFVHDATGDYGSCCTDAGYMCTNITDMNNSSDKWGQGDNAAIYENSNNYYVLVFPPYTAANTTSSPKICASTSLPEEYYASPSGRKIYFDNSAAKWAKVYFRRGHSCYNYVDELEKVPGTDSLYQYIAASASNGYQAFQLANNSSWADGYSIYKVDGEGYAITKGTVFQKYALDEDVTFTPGDADGDPSDGCQYYAVTKTSGMKTDRVTISDYSNGMVTVAYTDTEDAAQSFTSGNRDLAHTVILTVTAVPNTGYNLSALTVGGSAHTSGNTYTCSGNTTVSATFAANNYTVTLNNQSATTPGTPNVTATYNANTNLTSAITKPTKDGYTFGGYYTQTGGHGLQLIDENGDWNASIEGYTDASKNWIHVGNVELYARWVACTGYSFHSASSGEYPWESTCFTQVGSAHIWQIENYVIPSATSYYVGYQEDFWSSGLGDGALSKSVEKLWTATPAKIDDTEYWDGGMFLVPASEETAVTPSSFACGQATGAKGTLLITDNVHDNNLYVRFKPNGYGLTYAAGVKAFSYVSDHLWQTDIVTLTAADVSGTFKVGLATASAGTYVDCAMTSAYSASTMNTHKNALVSQQSYPAIPDMAADQEGRFVMWDNSADGQWYLSFLPVYTVDYDGNGSDGGSTPAAATKYRTNETPTVLANTYTRTGYTFAGWNTAAGGGGDSYAAGASLAKIGANVTLYAQWTANQYSVTHSLSNVTATSGATGSNAATYGTNYTAEFAAAVGYTLPDDITVTIGGASTTHYTWNASTGELTIDGDYILGNIVVTIVGESEGCTPQSLSKVSATKGTSGTVTGYNDGQYAGDAVVNLYSTKEQSASLPGVSTVDGYKMGDAGTSIVFATLKGTSFQAGDKVRIGITRRNDMRQVDSKYNILTIYYGTSKSDVAALTTITTGGDNDNSAEGSEGAGFYEYTLTLADVTAIGSKKGIGLFRESDNGENPYVYSVEIIGCREWATCTAPDAVAAGSVTGEGATFTITDAENTNNYEIYYSTSSTAPTAETSATISGISSKSRAVTGLTSETTYYYWVRSNCGGATKSSWVAGTPTSFTTSAAASTYSVTYSATDKTSGSVPTDASTYEEGDIVTVKGNTGSLAKTGYSFVGWNTASDGTGTFYPAGYKFYMGDANVTLYAVWGSTGATCVTLTDFETGSHDKSSGKPDSEGKYFYGYKGTKSATYAMTITTPSTGTVGVNGGDNLQMAQNTRFNIYADNTTTSGTPATFSNITSISFKIKAVKNTRIPTIDVYVGSTKVETVIGGDESKSDGHEYDTSDYTTISITGLASLSGIVKFVNTSSGSSDYKALFDDIQICYGSGAASGFTVSFDMNDHGSEIADIANVPSGSKIGAPVPAPTAVGVAFGGWYREAGCTNAWDFGSSTISKDTTLYAKWTTCAPSISAHPVAATYTQGNAATALSVTATGDGLNYQWYTSEDGSADIQGSSAIPGATSESYTPSTSLLGTIYYFCVVSNTCGNAVSNKAAITVNDSKPAPTANWDIDVPKEGGKGFTFSIEVNKNNGDNWDGELIASMLTLSDNAILDGASIVVDNTNKTISGTYGVKAGSSSPVTFYLLLPATATQSATRLDHNQAFTPCAGGGGGDSYNVRVRKDYNKDASNNYRWVTPGAGEITYAIGSSISSAKASSAVGDFDSIMSNDKQYVWVKTYEANTKTIRLHVETSGANVSVSNLYKNTVYATAAAKDRVSSDDYSVSYDGSGSAENTGAKGTHYMDITFDSPLDANDIICIMFSSSKVKAYGAILTTVGDGGDQTTGLTWSNDQASGDTIVKQEDAADFTITAKRDATALKSLGLISYTSSNTAIATIDGATGLVHIADNIDFGSDEYKTTTITATLAASGCYQKKVITYILKVTKHECADAPGTITYVDRGCSGMDLTLEGYEEGATIKWYKDGTEIPSATSATYNATEPGEYYAVTHKTCDITSTNSVTLEAATATAEKIVDSWYVKNGRRTPDIALVQTTGATSFTVTSGGTITEIGGCTFELKEDGIIYLHGQKEDGSAPSDMTAGDMTITITVSGCAGALSGLDITIHKQAETPKPSVAFVVDGTLRKDGGTATSVSTAKTSDRPLWTYLSSSYALTGCNAYWSVDSKELRQYYSQFDAILITDDPSTDTKGTGGVSYVKAFGTMVDVRPVLTMEAYVGKFKDGGWHVYDATPTSPNPRQVEMKLECKNHDIFMGLNPDNSDNVRSTTDDQGNEYWHVIMVDTTQAPYHNTSKNYKDLPALQGFDPTKFDHMLGVGTIADETLQGGVERQEEPAARMMILGIQNEAMAALTNEGKLIIKNAISYLLKTNMEDVNDCSNYFTGGDSGTGDNWATAANWSSGKVPDFETRVRILRPVVISGGTKAIVARVDIATRGTSKYVDGECNGSVTVNSLGALIVGGKIRRAEAPRFGIDDLMPTENDDLIVKAATDAPHRQGALIFDNSDGDTHAVVEMWNPSYWEVEGGKKKKYWSYVAVPIQEADIPNFFWHGFTYLYDETSGWIKKGDGTSLYPFQGIGASLQDGNMETFYGPLATTESQDITLTYTADKGQGMNLIGNSWTAPIQIANFEEDDFGDAAAEVWVFNTGNTNDGYGDGTTTTAGQWMAIPINAPSLPGYEGLKVIPAMQAFEVNTTSETTLHLDYNRLVRAGRENLNEPMRAPRRSAAKQIEATMRVRVSGESTHTDVYLLKDARFSDGFDNGWDGHYLSGDDRSAQLYAISEEEGKLAFLAQPEIEGTQLGFAPSKKDTEYTFSFSYDGDEEYYLNDIKLMTSTLINAENSYTFTFEDGDTNRFYISRTPIDAPQTPTGVDNTHSGEVKAQKFIYNDKMYIMINGRIYSAEGQIVK